jgi:hypothetical protein
MLHFSDIYPLAATEDPPALLFQQILRVRAAITQANEVECSFIGVRLHSVDPIVVN